MSAISENVRAAGVVGAGGAGFPAHIKTSSKVDIVIANGAECEPLIHKDFELMAHHAKEIVEGMRIVMDATGAKRGIIGIKEKNKTAVDAVQSSIAQKNIEIHRLGDFYPSGDEYVLVYEATGRLIPPQGIPLDVGIVVNNVETLLNISRAVNGIPVTQKFITVAGAVKKPVTCMVPIGTSYGDAIAIAGGASIKNFGVFVGGIMMGALQFDLTLPITKTTAGLVVLPIEHTLVQRKQQPVSSMHRIGKSACDQCTFCTELCPRYLLGYDVQPHKVMRSLGFTKTGEDIWNQYAQLCCACGLCTLYACPENLYPKEACDKAKHDLKEKKISWTWKTDITPHPMYDGRRTPLKQLMKKLNITDFEVPSSYIETLHRPVSVTIPLQQHIGAAAVPVVRTGEKVATGQLIGHIPEGTLGAAIHASIDGVVKEIGSTIIIERA